MDPVFPYPAMTGVTFSGAIDLSDVGLHPSLGGYYPSVRAAPAGAGRGSVRPAVLDFSHFGITIEDDPSTKGTVATDGTFALGEISLRDQAVLRFTSSAYKGFVLEWMGFDPQVLWGPRQIRVTVRSTARSIIARMLRNRHGRRLDPESITDAEIQGTVNALLDVLEKHPEKISAAVPLDQVGEVVTAAGTAADALAAGNRGIFSREWTILVYQAGDNDLDLAVKSDLEEMLKAGPPAQTALLVQADRPSTGVRRLWIREKGKEQVLAAAGQANAADPLLIGDFVAWGQRAFPARRFALIVASHGLGWRFGDPSRGVITDDPAGVTMDVLSLTAALTAAVTTPGPYVRPLDLIGFDACLMGLFEVACQLRACGRFLVFSQANEPSPGWPYDRWLGAVGSGAAALDGEALGRAVCDAYRGFYVEAGLDARYSGTLSLVRLDRMADLKTRFADWSAVLYRDRPTVGSALRGLRDALAAAPETLGGAERYLVQAFEMVDYRDLADLVAASRTSVPQANSLADQLMVSFREAVRYTVRFGGRYTRAQGLSIAFPGPGDIADYVGASAYPLLDLARDTSWDDLFTDLAIASAVSRVDGRALQATAKWSGGADLDLLVGEPDPQPLSGSQPQVWFSAVEGSTTPNGRFSLDSAKSGLSEESWRAEPTILPGRYLIQARFFAQSPVTTPTAVTVRVSNLATATEVAATLRPGEVCQAVAVEVAPGGGMTITPVAEPAPEEE